MSFTFFRRITSSVVLMTALLLFAFLIPTQAHANHFRAGTMSWEAVEGEERTVLIKMQIGWTNNHSHIPSNTPVGGVVTNKLTLFFGDGQSHNAALRVVSRNASTNDVQTELVSIKPGEEEYTEGVIHQYESDGNYVAYWSGSARESALNLDGSAWRNETSINIGGEYAGNSSPVSAVAAVVQVPDNTLFSYDLVGIDKDGDDVRFRYGSKSEFYGSGSGDATEPTGLEIDENGSISWDVRDESLDTDIGDRWQMTVMVEDLDDKGMVKSYIPLDFVLLISDSANLPPTITSDTYSHTVAVGESLEFEVVGEDPDWQEEDNSPTMSVVNPPSANPEIWSTSTESNEEQTTMQVTFTPTQAMQGNSYVIVFQATDDGGNSTTRNISINVSSVSPTPTPTPEPDVSPTHQPTATPTTPPKPAKPPVCHEEKAVAPSLYRIDSNNSSATVHFTPVEGFAEYLISYSTNSNAEEHSVKVIAPSSANQAILIEDLQANATYYFKVRVENTCMPGEWSEIRSSATVSSVTPSTLFSETQNELTVTEIIKETPLPSACTYTVMPGDSLWALAEETLGDGNRYLEIVEFNKEKYPNIGSYLEKGWVLDFACESQNEDLPHDHDETGGFVKSYVNAVTILVERNGVPLAGAEVELHSDPKYGKTDQHGKVTFTDVEPGEHTLKLAYQAYATEQKVTIEEGVEDFSIKVTVEMEQQISKQWWLALLIGVLIGLGLFFLIGKRRSKNEGPPEKSGSLNKLKR